MPTHFSDRIEMGMSDQEAGFTIQPRRRRSPTVSSCPVERGARRLARHVRERLLEVIPGYQPGVIARFYLMRLARPRMRASGTRLPMQCGRSVLFKAGARRLRGASNPPAGFGPKPRGQSGERPAGSFNARWRRELPGGDTEEPEDDNLRGSAAKADREKLNDERGASPCQ